MPEGRIEAEEADAAGAVSRRVVWEERCLRCPSHVRWRRWFKLRAGRLAADAAAAARGRERRFVLCPECAAGEYRANRISRELFGEPKAGDA